MANRVLAVAGRLFSWVEEEGFRPAGSNPVPGVRPYPERSRERFLSELELTRLGDAIAEEQRQARAEGNPDRRRQLLDSSVALLLLIFTGCRLGEILGLKWFSVDLERKRRSDQRTRCDSRIRDRIKRLRRSGNTIRGIAETVGVAKSTVEKVLKHRG